jgi:hypothetical protein
MSVITHNGNGKKIVAMKTKKKNKKLYHFKNFYSCAAFKPQLMIKFSSNMTYELILEKRQYVLAK